MPYRIKLFLIILPVLFAVSCSTDDAGGEKDYISTKDRKLCDCYRERHNRIQIDYDSELKKDFKFWQSKFKQLKHMNRESIINLISAFEKGQIVPGADSTEILNYQTKIEMRFLSECIEWDSYFNRESKQYGQMVEVEMNLPWDNSRKSWKIRMEARKKIINKIDDGQWLNSIYLFVAKEVYGDTKKMQDFEKARSIQVEIDEENRKRQKEYDKLERNIPPPPKLIAPPEMEEIWEEDQDDEL
jgi:hypothetical protein